MCIFTSWAVLIAVNVFIAHIERRLSSSDSKNCVEKSVHKRVEKKVKSLYIRALTRREKKTYTNIVNERAREIDMRRIKRLKIHFTATGLVAIITAATRMR